MTAPAGAPVAVHRSLSRVGSVHTPVRRRATRTAVKTILSLCDYSGVWSAPYEEAGYHVIRVDMALEGGQDIRTLHYIDRPVYGILAAPPCTMFAASGARWERTEEEMHHARALVDACLRAVAIYRPHFWALENPVGKLPQWYGDPVMYFDPCEFAGYADDPDAEAYTKKTGLWGRFNPPRPCPLAPVLGSKMHLMSPSPDRAQKRSVTPSGFARAFMEANL